MLRGRVPAPAVAFAVGVFSMTVSSAPRLGQSDLRIPPGPLAFGMFIARFGSDGTFTLEGRDWPTFKGTWKAQASEIELSSPAKRTVMVRGVIALACRACA